MGTQTKAEHKRTIGRLKHDLRGIHEYRPKYIFLTDTSAIPFGYELKASWKYAYPGEEAPQFYRVDPKALRYMMYVSKKFEEGDETKKEEALKFRKEIADFFGKRIKNQKDKILVYDEHSEVGQTPQLIVNLLKNPETYGLTNKIKCKDVKRSISEMELMHLRDPKHFHQPVSWNEKVVLKDVLGIRQGIPYPYENPKDYDNAERHINVTKKDTTKEPPPYESSVDLRGKRRTKEEIEDDIKERLDKFPFDFSDWQKGFLEENKHRTPGIRLIKMYKATGKEAGLELREERKRKQNLEQKVISVIAAIGLLGSLIFLQSNFTGNAIVNLSTNTTSWISGVLLLIGLVAGFFWVRSKRK